MSLYCAWREKRAAMDDDEFWEDVALMAGGVPPVEYDWMAEPPATVMIPMFSSPCPECGEWNGCAVDSEGRVLIHAINDPDD